MKNVFTFILTLIFSTSLYSQNSNFEKGYKEGFAKGYCYNQSVTCIGKAPAIAPIPKVNENSNSYQDGYNRGFSDGLEYRRTETQSGSEIKNQEIKFTDYISQIPSNSLSILAYKEKLFNERKEWIENTMESVHRFLTTKFVDLDADDAKKWYDSMLDFQNKLGDKWPDLSQNDMFNPIKTFLLDYTTSLVKKYNSIKNEADASIINFDANKYTNLPESSFLIIDFYGDGNGKRTYNLYQYGFKSRSIRPDSEAKLQVKANKWTTLNIIYVQQYDSYYYYFDDSIVTKKTTKGNESSVIASEYRKGGHGNPIFIKLSDSTCVIYDKGKEISANFLGVVRFKLNTYDSIGTLIKSSYLKSKCWQDRFSGKKYFLNSGYLKDTELFKDELLISNNKE